MLPDGRLFSSNNLLNLIPVHTFRQAALQAGVARPLHRRRGRHKEHQPEGVGEPAADRLLVDAPAGRGLLLGGGGARGAEGTPADAEGRAEDRLRRVHRDREEQLRGLCHHRHRRARRQIPSSVRDLTKIVQCIACFFRISTSH